SATFAQKNAAFAQESGSFWVRTFNPGSADLNDSTIDQKALAKLDSLLQNPDVNVTFLGAADSIGWVMYGKKVHDKIAEAWNDAKRLSRARALRARYGRGEVGITHDSVAGVKVIWTRTGSDAYTNQLDQLKEQNDAMMRELAEVKNNLESIKPEPTNGHNGNGANGNGASKNGHSKYMIKDGLTFNWRLQAGLWTWQSGANGNLVSPSVALNIIVNKTAFVLQGGVTPWHQGTEFGNKSESFVYTGVKYMKSERLGFTAGAFRGWEFFTTTDNWLFKTTGLATGVVLTYGKFEFNPTITISNINTLENSSDWKVGSTLGLNFNIN
ncbi:MAG TPA: hypothetical protein VGA99_12720, partial [bacterium]